MSVMNRHTLSWSPFVFLFSVVLIVLAGSPLQAQVKLYVPAVTANDGADLGIALVNPELTPTTVTLTARNYSGGLIEASGLSNPVTLTLPASSQKALRASEIFGSPISGRTGWVELSAASSAVKGFYLVFDSALTYIDGAELSSAPAKRLVFPK